MPLYYWKNDSNTVPVSTIDASIPNHTDPDQNAYGRGDELTPRRADDEYPNSQRDFIKTKAGSAQV